MVCHRGKGRRFLARKARACARAFVRAFVRALCVCACVCACVRLSLRARIWPDLVTPANVHSLGDARPQHLPLLRKEGRSNGAHLSRRYTTRPQKVCSLAHKVCTVSHWRPVCKVFSPSTASVRRGAFPRRPPNGVGGHLLCISASLCTAFL
jgi:hypothetical protein